MINKILVSQPKPSSPKSPYFDLESKYGVNFTFHPFIKVERLSTREFRDQKVSILDHTAIVFNSRHAIDHFFNMCKDLRITVPEDMKYFCISEVVALYIQKYVQYRKRKVFFGKTGKWPSLIDVMVKHSKESYLVPQSSVHTDEVQQLLEAEGLDHTECVMYRTVPNQLPEDIASAYNMVVFFTPSGIDSLLKNFPNFEQGETRIACFGHKTAKAIQDAGLRLDLEAPNQKSHSITGAIEEYLKENNK